MYDKTFFRAIRKILISAVYIKNSKIMKKNLSRPYFRRMWFLRLMRTLAKHPV